MSQPEDDLEDEEILFQPIDSINDDGNRDVVLSEGEPEHWVPLPNEEKVELKQPVARRKIAVPIDFLYSKDDLLALADCKEAQICPAEIDPVLVRGMPGNLSELSKKEREGQQTKKKGGRRRSRSPPNSRNQEHPFGIGPPNFDPDDSFVSQTEEFDRLFRQGRKKSPSLPSEFLLPGDGETKKTRSKKSSDGPIPLFDDFCDQLSLDAAPIPPLAEEGVSRGLGRWFAASGTETNETKDPVKSSFGNSGQSLDGNLMQHLNLQPSSSSSPSQGFLEPPPGVFSLGGKPGVVSLGNLPPGHQMPPQNLAPSNDPNAGRALLALLSTGSSQSSSPSPTSSSPIPPSSTSLPALFSSLGEKPDLPPLPTNAVRAEELRFSGTSAPSAATPSSIPSLGLPPTSQLPPSEGGNDLLKWFGPSLMMSGLPPLPPLPQSDPSQQPQPSPLPTQPQPQNFPFYGGGAHQGAHQGAPPSYSVSAPSQPQNPDDVTKWFRSAEPQVPQSSQGPQGPQRLQGGGGGMAAPAPWAGEVPLPPQNGSKEASFSMPGFDGLSISSRAGPPPPSGGTENDQPANGWAPMGPGSSGSGLGWLGLGIASDSAPGSGGK